MSYDVYVNLHYDEGVIRRLVDIAERVDFFGDGETAHFAPTQFAAHNDRFRDTPAHQSLHERLEGVGDGHGFILIVNRDGKSAALHDAGPGDFAHARETIRDLAAWLRANAPGSRLHIASVASSDGYADYAYMGVLGGWQVTDAGDGLTPAAAAL